MTSGSPMASLVARQNFRMCQHNSLGRPRTRPMTGSAAPVARRRDLARPRRTRLRSRKTPLRDCRRYAVHVPPAARISSTSFVQAAQCTLFAQPPPPVYSLVRRRIVTSADLPSRTDSIDAPALNIAEIILRKGRVSYILSARRAAPSAHAIEQASRRWRGGRCERAVKF